MRQSFSLLLALFVSVAFAACEQTPVGMDGDSSSLTPSGKPAHAHGPVVVDENPDHRWIFNRDQDNFTPAGFTFDAAVLGAGSLHADPITGSGSAKFILEYGNPDDDNLGIPVSDFGGFSIDFLVDGVNNPVQFYINVYTFMDPPNGTFYDCRFDYVADDGSTTDWMTLAVGGTPSAVASRNGTTCPASLGQMPAGSTISFFSVNIGDTSTNDNGIGGYFDNAVVTVGGTTTTYDFEPNCKKGGWQSLTRPDGSSFKNQGQCMKYSKTGK